MRRNAHYYIACAAVIILATWLRVHNLDLRPMHTDEAVHAVKFGELLEKGDYFYDYDEYHGPTLNYFTLLPAWLSNHNSYADLNETVLRIVPAMFGLFLCAGLLFLAPGLGRMAALFSALFAAVSPAMVFYSRYYIQEMLLVFFTLCTILAFFYFFQTRKVVQAGFAGLCLGLMNATKETWIISVAVFFIALMSAIIWHQGRIQLQNKRTLWRGAGIAFVAFALISVLFFSSFGKNPIGIWHSVYTYFTYFDRAANNSIHIHPWYFYLKLLTYFKIGEGPLWTEAAVLTAAIIGIIAIINKNNKAHTDGILPKFFVVYALLMLAVYSLIPYKTPWNLLSFYLGFILLAGIGVAELFRMISKHRTKTAVGFIFFFVIVHLLWQTFLGNGKYDAHPANPYVYAHTHPDIFKIVDRLQDISSKQPEKNNLYIQVMCSGKDYWPLPWYLRQYTQVGWWSHVPARQKLAPIVILTPDLEADFVEHNYELSPPGHRYLYIPLFEEMMYLRPGIELRCYIRKKEWDVWQRTGAEQAFP
ncbi:MAG: TIGR03663 family protein [Calditrichaeota bacterium]|nr:MAG: TIGR03663 family protein [Calditrichota bacterium]